MRGKSAREWGDGTLARVTDAVYWFLVTGVLLIVVTLPGTLPLLFLDRSAGNAPLVALCLAPVAPGVAAALFSLRDRPRAEALTPAPSFFRGYRLNWADALRAAAPLLVFAAVAGLGAGALGDDDGVTGLLEGGLPSAYGGVMLGIGAILLVWTINALVIASFFSFRTRDVARLASYYLFTRWKVALGSLSLLVVASAVLLLAGDAVFALLGVIWVWLVERNHAPLVRDVTENFTTAGEG
ncbi:DUF624 domain-containing protein [Myceligenerans cantabricum]